MSVNLTIEQFVGNCIKARTTTLKTVLKIRRAYRRRFYDNECLWDSRDGCVELSEEEKIVGLDPSEIGLAVITTGSHPNHRSRYRVETSGESWLIQEVDAECSRCHLLGSSSNCPDCGGTGWLSWQDQRKRVVRHVDSPARIYPETYPELEWDLPLDPALERFMTDYFQERTVALKKEMEIFSEYAKRFYTPKCEWTRWVVSVQESEAEKIVNIMPTDQGAYVITSGFGPMFLRYHLRREGQDWLIQEVDNECPVCYQQGRKPDCFWCRGTIWEHKKD